MTQDDITTLDSATADAEGLADRKPARKQIFRSVVLGARKFLPGQEDELEDELTQEEVDALVERGALLGSWEGRAKAPVAAEAPQQGAHTPLYTAETLADMSKAKLIALAAQYGVDMNGKGTGQGGGVLLADLQRELAAFFLENDIEE